MGADGGREELLVLVVSREGVLLLVPSKASNEVEQCQIQLYASPHVWANLQWCED
jgi:hypothetical protein